MPSFSSTRPAAVVAMCLLAAGSAWAGSTANAGLVPYDDHGSPGAFVRSIYDHYGKDNAGPDLQGRGAQSLASPALLKLIEADRKAADGEAGAFDADPICRCQDPDGLRVLTIVNRQNNAASALVDVELDYPQDDHEHAAVTFALVRIGGAWRIDNITARDFDFAGILQDGLGKGLQKRPGVKP